MIERIFTHFRKVSIIAVLASVLGSLLMFIIGAVKVARAYDAYFFTAIEPGSTLKMKAGLAIAFLVQAIDAFLIRENGRLIAHVHPSETRDLEAMPGRGAYYDPYRFASFVDRETHRPVTAASVAQLDERGVVYS